RRVFYGCSNFPTCNFAIWEKPVPELCPHCGGLMVVPRVGQDPVCYEEVIAVQRNGEEKPHQDGATTRGGTRKKATPTKDTELVSQATSTNGRVSKTVKKAATGRTRGKIIKSTRTTRAKTTATGKKTINKSKI